MNFKQIKWRTNGFENLECLQVMVFFVVDEVVWQYWNGVAMLGWLSWGSDGLRVGTSKMESSSSSFC